MGNRRKPRRPDLSIDGSGHMPLPPDEKILVKTVPAVIHWSQFEDIERNDDEVVGETLIYQDGSHDIIIQGDISENAKKVMGFYDQLHLEAEMRENN